MLKNSKVFGSFSVDNIEKAKKFYGQTLGLDVSENMGILSLDVASGYKVFAYPTPDLQTDAKGIHWNPDKTKGPDVAWFTDPAGNILSVLSAG